MTAFLLILAAWIGCSPLMTLATKRPNIVLFLQDDQDFALGGWSPMQLTEAKLVANGTRAKNWFIHTPVCCPSRAELLSGRYFHNVRMPTQKGGCMHVDTEKVNPFSFASYLSSKGNYTSGWFGKHMNQAPHSPPVGFDCPSCYWFANGGGSDVEPGGYLNATFSDFAGGKPVGGSPYHKTPGTYRGNTHGEFAGYTTSIIANKSIEWVKKVAKGPQPFFVTVASKGPHVPATPAPWYTNAFSDRVAPRTPDYNASAEQLAGHHWLISQQGPITAQQGETIDELFRNRWRTLLSIDEAIAAMHDTIEELGLLNQTYFFITSDHGYNLGQHRLPSCKLNVYDHDVRIPMIIKGPGIKPGSTFHEPASNVDVAPTILGLAGLEGYSMSPPMDGRSIAHLLIDKNDDAVLPVTREHLLSDTRYFEAPWRNHHFVEYYSLGNIVRTGHLVDDPNSNTYRALRFTHGGPVGSGNILFAEFTALTDWDFKNVSFVEVFDVEKDPHQLVNLAEHVDKETKHLLHTMLESMSVCRGLSCERHSRIQYV